MVRVSTGGFDSLYNTPLVKGNNTGLFIKTKVDDSEDDTYLKMRLACFFIPWCNIKYIEY